MRKIEYGDVIFVDKGIYRHFGIYSGNGKVIHYYHAAEKICETSFAEFMDGDSYCYICDFDEDGKRTSEGRGFLPAMGGGLFFVNHLDFLCFGKF